jgi:uncharacterized protein YmfQ (DUF2313 family)
MLDFGEVFKDDIQLESDAIRALKLSAETIITEMLPDTATDLEKYETQYDIYPNESATIDERRTVVISAMRALGGLSIPYFESLAESLGYTIGSGTSVKWLEITDGIYVPFRAGISKAGDKVFGSTSGTEAYTWRVTGTNVESDTALIELFESLKPFGTTIEFTNT